MRKGGTVSLSLSAVLAEMEGAIAAAQNLRSHSMALKSAATFGLSCADARVLNLVFKYQVRPYGRTKFSPRPFTHGANPCVCTAMPSCHDATCAPMTLAILLHDVDMTLMIWGNEVEA